tara:strand:- start:234 stop:446 length:213 start_codon:yes stop_codon:yes gene_type:complete
MNGYNQIATLLNDGMSRDEVFAELLVDFPTIVSKKQRQQLADTIAQIDMRNMFATGQIPRTNKGKKNDET